MGDRRSLTVLAVGAALSCAVAALPVPAQEPRAEPPVVVTPAERARTQEIIVLRNGRVAVPEGDLDGVRIELDAEPDAGRARAAAERALDRDEVGADFGTPETVVIRRIAPSPGGSGGAIEIRLEEATAAGEARARAVQGSERGSVSGYAPDDGTEVIFLEGSPGRRPGTVINLSKTPSGNACVVVGTIGAGDEACASRR